MGGTCAKQAVSFKSRLCPSVCRSETDNAADVGHKQLFFFHFLSLKGESIAFDPENRNRFRSTRLVSSPRVQKCLDSKILTALNLF